MRIRIPRKSHFLRHAKATLLAASLVLGGATVVHAAESDGTFDAAFGDNGLKEYAPFGSDSTRPVKSVAISGNKVLTLATTTDAQYQSTGFGLIQTTSTGAYDTSFNGVGYRKFNLSSPVTGYTPSALHVTGSGLIYVGGTFNSSSGGGIFTARLTSAGALDNTWGTNGIAHTAVEFQAFNVAMHVAASGLVYYMGYGNYDWFMRLDSTGAIDTSFGRTGANGAGYYMGIFMGSPYPNYVTRSLFGFSVDESTTPHSVNVFSAPSGAQIVIQHLKFGTSQTAMTGNGGTTINLYQAEADASWAATSLISGSSTATNGYLRVDVPGNNVIVKSVLASSNILYVVTNTSSSIAHKIAALDLSQKRLLSGFGTGGILDVSSFNFDGGTGLSGVAAEAISGDTLFLYGYDTNYKGVIAKVSGGAIATSFGTNGAASFAPCQTLAPVAFARTADGALHGVAAYSSNNNPTKIRISRLASGGSSTSCGTTTTASTLPQGGGGGGGGGGIGGGGGGGFTALPMPVATIVEEPGRGIKVTVTNLVAGAHLGVVVMPTPLNLGPNSTEYPGMTEFATGVSTVTVSGVRLETQQMVFIRTQLLQAGLTYRVMVYQLVGTSVNPTAMSPSTTTNVTMTQNAVEAPATSVPAASASTASTAGVTVTDTKVYATTAPAKVSAESAITVMTPAQARTSDIVTKTPDVCLPANDDIVFIDTGKCVAQIVNEKTGKVLRTLRTTVVEDEVSELNVGNEIAVLAPVYFDAGSSVLNAAATGRLRSIKSQVSAAGTVLLVGHSGIMLGDTPENRALSKARAVAVANGLKAIKAKGPFYVTPVGAADPAVKKKTEAAQARNRRVVIVLVP